LDFANIAAVMSAGFGALTKLIQLFSMSQTTSVTNFMLALLDKSAQPILFDDKKVILAIITSPKRQCDAE